MSDYERWDTDDLIAEGFRLSQLLDDALAFFRNQVEEAASLEHDYRKARSEAWQMAPDGRAREEEDWVKASTAGARERRDVAEGMKRAAVEAIRSRRQQISLVQSAMSARKSETEFAATGPERTP